MAEYTLCVDEPKQKIIPPKDPPSGGLPAGGEPGQVLTIDDEGNPAWAAGGGSGVTLYNETGQSTTGGMTQKAITDELDKKVEKEDGKGLSANDYTDEDAEKLSGLADIKSIGSGLSLDKTTGELTATGDSGGTKKTFKLKYTEVSYDSGVWYYDGAELDGATYKELYDAVKAGADVIVELLDRNGTLLEMPLTATSSMDDYEDSVIVFGTLTKWYTGDISDLHQAFIGYWETRAHSTEYANAFDLYAYLSTQIEAKVQTVPLQDVKAWFGDIEIGDDEFGMFGASDNKTTNGYIRIYNSAEMTNQMNPNEASYYYSQGKTPRLFIDNKEVNLTGLTFEFGKMGPNTFQYKSFRTTWDGKTYDFYMGAAEQNAAGGFYMGTTMREV